MMHTIIDKISRSIKTKILFMLLIFMMIAIVVVSIAFYNKSYSKTSEIVEGKIISIIDIASNFVDGDKLGNLDGERYIEDEYFEYITNKFTLINESDNHINLYLFINQTGKEELLIIGQEQLYTYINKSTLEANFLEKMKEVYETGEKKIIESFCKEGTQLLGIIILAPILNENREVTGVLVCDYQNKDLIDNIRSINFEILHIAIILMTIGISINYIVLRKMFNPIESLLEAIDEISKGDMTVNMEVQTVDEIGRIKQAINNNVNKISTILSCIKFSSNQVNIASKSIIVSSRDAIEALNELSSSIDRINNMTEIQREYSKEISDILEQLSDDGENIYNQILNGRKCTMTMRNLMSELQNISNKDGLDEIYDMIIKGQEDLRVFGEISEKLLDGMATHIKDAFTKTNDIKETAELIDSNTKGLAAIAEQQMATSEEFSNMAIMLKEQAVVLDEKISVFKIK